MEISTAKIYVDRASEYSTDISTLWFWTKPYGERTITMSGVFIDERKIRMPAERSELLELKLEQCAIKVYSCNKSKTVMEKMSLLLASYEGVPGVIALQAKKTARYDLGPRFSGESRDNKWIGMSICWSILVIQLYLWIRNDDHTTVKNNLIKIGSSKKIIFNSIIDQITATPLRC